MFSYTDHSVGLKNNETSLSVSFYHICYFIVLCVRQVLLKCLEVYLIVQECVLIITFIAIAKVDYFRRITSCPKYMFLYSQYNEVSETVILAGIIKAAKTIVKVSIVLKLYLSLLTAVTASILGFSFVTPCGIVHRLECFLGTFCLHRYCTHNGWTDVMKWGRM